MPLIEVDVSCPVYDSFRVQQVGGMFDLAIGPRAAERFRVEMPEVGDDWRVGLIAGPSGSGKTTIARRMFGEHLYRAGAWPDDRAVIDGFGNRPVKEIVAALTAVGFGSPPGWIKPYRVLSGGEQFRCDLARALLAAQETGDGPRPIVAFDEFTSVVDRNVAKIASAAVARSIRSDTIRCRFVAITCHYDVAEWLEPDWMLDMAARRFDRRRLRRPKIELKLARCRHAAWAVFARHHYLSGSLSPSARCFLASWQGVPVSFCATLPLVGRQGRWRVTRLVTLPDFQGVGIGSRVLEAVAVLHRAEGLRVSITTSHPAVIGHCRRSPLWRAVSVKRGGSCDARHLAGGYRSSVGRGVVSFEYAGAEG